MAWRRGQAYGQDLRDRVLACPELTLVQVATRFGVSPSYVSKVRARLRDLGDAAPGPQHNHVPLRLAPFADALRAEIAARPDAKLRELRSWLASTHAVRVSHPVLWKVVARLGLTLKKSSCGPRSRTARI
jgi:transposase